MTPLELTISTWREANRWARLRSLLSSTPGALPTIGGAPPREPVVEAELLRITNQHRATLSGVSATQLVPNLTLDGIAGWKAADMATANPKYLQHDQPSQSAYPNTTVWQRFAAGGWPAELAAGENAAYGLQTAQALFDAWMSDLGHRQNLEGPWNVCGMAVVTAANGLKFAVQDFGWIPGGQPPGPPPPPPDPSVPQRGDRYRKKAAHQFIVIVDDVVKGVPKRVYAHEPGQPERSRSWPLPTFRRNFERVPA